MAKVKVNGQIYVDWEVVFDGQSYKLFGYTEADGPKLLIKDYSMEAFEAYDDFQEITNAAVFGEEVQI